MRVSVVIVVLAGACAPTGALPRLERVEPALVTSLVATPALLYGSALHARASVDLDSKDPAVVDRDWQIRIAGVAIDDVSWRDRETLNLTIPPGLQIGLHDVFVTAPGGRELVLPQALTVTASPIGLALSIEDAPGGSGQPVSATLEAGTSLTAFAVARNSDRAFVADVPAEWSLTSPIGVLAGISSPAVTFHARSAGTARLRARHAGAANDAESGEVTITAGAAAEIRIMDDAGGAGAVIGNRSGLTTDADGGLTAHAAGFDAFGNYTGDVSVTWNVSGVTATHATSGTLTALDFTLPGAGVLHASHATMSPAATGTLVVSPGRAAALSIAPSSRTLSADDPSAAFTVTATDADGNATTNFGALSWSIASGPITMIDPVLGVLEPTRSGSGTIAVTSSWGASAVSGAVVIEPGAPAAVSIVPSSLTVSADDAPVAFAAAAVDADGNELGNMAADWAIASGPISALTSTGTLDPRAAGAGTISANVGGIVATAPVTISPGRVSVLSIAPQTAQLPQGGTPVAFTASGVDADGNPTSDLGMLAWTVASGPIATLADSTGMLTPTAAGTGTIRATSSYGPSVVSGAVQILPAATLTASISAPAEVSVGQTFAVTMMVFAGNTTVTSATTCALTATGLMIESSPAPVTTIAANESATFTWTVTATVAGSVTLASCVTATDTASNMSISAPGTGTTRVLASPHLTATFDLPEIIGRGSPFTLTMTITNTGEVTATGVVPGALTTSGTSSVMLSAGPSAGASIAPGGSATFYWTYVAAVVGTVQFHGGAAGTDALSLFAVRAPDASSEVSDVVESYIVASDALGDGSPIGFVAAYRGEVYIGPNQTGARAVRASPEDMTLAPVSFTFAQDVTGNKTSNTSAIPYTSLGAPGCAPNTTACGPDNENERGLFTPVLIAGTEWLIATGARTGVSTRLYMTPDSATNLGFRYVDLSSIISSANGSNTSALAGVGSRLYIGASGHSAKRAKLLAMRTQPPAPGLDATNYDVEDMRLDRLASWSTDSDAMNVDAIASHGPLVYVAQRSAWVRADVASPLPVDTLCQGCSDWITVTPSAAAYTARASRSTPKTSQLEPRDRAIPQIAAFSDHLFVARNTVAGPQLWSCSAVTSRCDPGDWSLVAPNSLGDTLLTQFDNPSLTSITVLVATPGFLYVGFDSLDGVQLFRTANPAAAARSDFEGSGGCSAAQHPTSCQGYGGTGLGNASTTRFFDAAALTSAGTTSVWVTVGTGSDPVSLVVLP